jgi:hypothetical protein
MSDHEVHYTYNALLEITNELSRHQYVDGVYTFDMDDSWVVGIEIADGEHAWMMVPEFVDFEDFDYGSDKPHLRVMVAGEVFEKPLDHVDDQLATQTEAVDPDAIETMYGTAIPSEIDADELRRLVNEVADSRSASANRHQSSTKTDEEGLTLKEALSRLDVQNSVGDDEDDEEEAESLRNDELPNCDGCGALVKNKITDDLCINCLTGDHDGDV